MIALLHEMAGEGLPADPVAEIRDDLGQLEDVLILVAFNELEVEHLDGIQELGEQLAGVIDAVGYLLCGQLSIR